MVSVRVSVKVSVRVNLVYQARPTSLTHWKLCRPVSERNGSRSIDFNPAKGL